MLGVWPHAGQREGPASRHPACTDDTWRQREGPPPGIRPAERTRLCLREPRGTPACACDCGCGPPSSRVAPARTAAACCGRRGAADAPRHHAGRRASARAAARAARRRCRAGFGRCGGETTRQPVRGGATACPMSFPVVLTIGAAQATPAARAARCWTAACSAAVVRAARHTAVCWGIRRVCGRPGRADGDGNGRAGHRHARPAAERVGCVRCCCAAAGMPRGVATRETATCAVTPIYPNPDAFLRHAPFALAPVRRGRTARR